MSAKSNGSNGPPTAKDPSRWSKVRLAVHTTNAFKKSLRQEEHDLLQFINNVEESKHEEDDFLSEHPHQQHRESIRMSMGQSNLNSKEKTYLEALIASPDVPENVLEQAHHAIRRETIMLTSSQAKDYILTQLEGIEESCESIEVETDMTITEKPEEPAKSSSEAKKDDGAFRKELWKLALEKVREDIGKKKKERQLQREEAKAQKEAATKQKPTSPLGSLFGMLSSPSVDEAEESSELDIFDDEDDELMEYAILGARPDDADTDNYVLTPPIMDQLRQKLPQSVKNDNFWLKYSLSKDGASVRAMVEKMRNSSRSILCIETMQGEVFGAFVSSPWIPRGAKYFGSGEAFVWNLSNSRSLRDMGNLEEQLELEHQVQMYPWSGQNRNVQRLESAEAQLIIGGGGPDEDVLEIVNADESKDDHGFALVLAPELETGYSNACLTFKSPSLPVMKGEDTFDIFNMEVWTLTPMNDIDQAEKVEYGRRFIFDNSNFREE